MLRKLMKTKISKINATILIIILVIGFFILDYEPICLMFAMLFQGMIMQSEFDFIKNIS